MRVYLTGFSASGKTTIGRLLAPRLKARFVDIDQRIEKRSGQTIPEIFSLKGEKAFRKLEFEEIARVHDSSEQHLVVALGGGALQNPAVRKALRYDGVIVYLSCSARELYRRLRSETDRPMLEVKPRPGETASHAHRRRIRALVKQRKDNYLKADMTISTTSRTPSQAAKDLYRMIRRYHAGH